MFPKSLWSGVVYSEVYIEDMQVSTDEVIWEKNYENIGCPPWRESADDWKG